MSPARTFWIILTIGMGLRLAWAVAVPVMPMSDSWAYHQFARNIVDHGIYGWTASEPTAYWAVGTSAAIAFTYLFTDSYWGVVILNLLAGGLAIVLTHALATRWFGATVGLAAMALVAIWPNLIVFTTILSSELFFIALTLAGLFFWQRPAGHPLANLILAGLIWGIAGYVRPVILLVPVALALADLARGPRGFARTALEAGVAMLLILLVALPWTIRNDRVLGAPVMVSTNFGPNLWMGNNPDSRGGYMPLPPEVETMSEIERAEFLKDKARQFMRDHPGQALKLAAIKLFKLNNRETIGVVWNGDALEPRIGGTGMTLLKLVATGYWYLVFLGGFAGIAVLVGRAGWIAALFNPPVALWGYFTALHAVVVAEDRYHMPSSAFIAMMAALALVALWRRWQARSGHPVARMGPA
ncbi:ArnT family glycosyltransferase [Paracoccus spongiarum]|uniref:Glycosyltransferase family 39 protein n=1 Tax=Paracoccus spongiarum TaxID=3064387 RepID=A0ABT9J7S8_9RHOB|nr:glycosyltransferase family 39 protein [Paracoccus sp. 2205BS29-5]MDP5305857.1 glycosyltransferase family 39 protein [Paracoccus sp. 2205BS29-5]